ncbi:unnamed protein product, partial [Sphacelaria rigidula]
DNIKGVAWQLGKICGMQEFVASNQWLKKFKSRFPNLETRYSHLLQSSDRGNFQQSPGDGSYKEEWGSDDRNSADMSTGWTDAGTSGVAVAVGPGGASESSQASTAGSYLAMQRARVEQESD